MIFSAVTDPAAAGLVENLEAPEGNITGTSDAIPVEKIFELAAELTPDAESFGLIYNTGEVNSVSVIDETKAYLDAQGISYTEASVASTGDVQTAAQTLLSKCDAIFAPIDNTVASAMGVLADEAIKAGKPVYVAADSMVNDGGLATVGVNYTNLGTQTADMLLKVLTGTPVCEVPVEVLKENAVVVNEETAAAIGVDVSKYARSAARGKGHCNEKQNMRRTAHPCAVPASGRLRGRGFLRYIRFLPGGALFWCGFRYAGRKGLYRGHPPADGTHLSGRDPGGR